MIPGIPPKAEIAMARGLKGIDTPVNSEVQFIAINKAMPVQDVRKAF